MKKIVCIFLACVMMLSLISCAENSGETNGTDGTPGRETAAGTDIPGTTEGGDQTGSTNGTDAAVDSNPTGSTEDTNGAETGNQDPSNPGETEDVTVGELNMIAPNGEVFPYIDTAKRYLQAAAGSWVSSYYNGTRNPCKAICVQWEYTGNAIESQILTYATLPDYSDGIDVSLGKEARSYDLYNLYKGTKYYCRITAEIGGGKTLTAESTFTTTGLGPRVMNIGGIYNVRDLGGYVTEGNKTTLQGLIYRGGALMPYSPYDSQLTAEGKAYMSSVLGIKTDLDLRGNGAESGGITESPIPGAKLVYIKVDGYTGAFTQKESFRQVFSLLADINNYPVYMHCTGGADRTGTVAFLLNALVGVQETDLVHDYEFTTFSVYGERNSQAGQYGQAWKTLRDTIDTYPGDTLSDRVENYMLSIGVTAEEIANIRAIMLGGKPAVTVIASESFNPNDNMDLVLQLKNLVSGDKVSGVEIDGKTVPYAQNGSAVTVACKDVPKTEKSSLTGKVTLTDGRTYSFQFSYDRILTVTAENYLPFENGTITLDAQNASVTGSTPIGYGKKVKLNLQSVMSGQHGGIWVFIGSYGIYLRGGTWRAWTMAEGSEPVELNPRVEICACYQDTFEDGVPMYFCLDIVDENTVRASFSVECADGSVITGEYDFKRIENEISEENACLRIAILTSEIQSLTISLD